MDKAKNDALAIKQLRAENEQLRQQLAETQAENAAMRTALEWYADTENYMIPHSTLVDGIWTVTTQHEPAVSRDRGEMARKALGRE